ncbi:hypothetical protein HBI56_142480 [Parastagonospora nodorum]|nr:hypothetical protein HBH52_092400 [Parastagonospora nodorum]KAH4047213.1 hypothetical protein HBH49_171130 [Parastagonospora nodorum]KAH4243414.1 hypothetical protein HBI05_083420 [Parastagonospora nodorum]KAH4244255.1 hypothetical protein HBI06_008420 [Parastagonospora nodorum]KAH4262405.1 hypothetical protein HBI03_109480 [Parastagonospora nodorum]
MMTKCACALAADHYLTFVKCAISRWCTKSLGFMSSGGVDLSDMRCIGAWENNVARQQVDAGYVECSPVFSIELMVAYVLPDAVHSNPPLHVAWVITITISPTLQARDTT